MREKTLLKIALVISLVGLSILYLISGNIQIKEKSIEKITFDSKDEMVKVRGIVSKIADTEKVTILEITQPTEIVVVVLKGNNDTTPIKEGNEVEIIGKVDDYNNKLEIIAKKARIIR